MNKRYKFLFYIFILLICLVYLVVFKNSAYYFTTINNRSKDDTSFKEIQKWIPTFVMYDSSEIKWAQLYSRDSMNIYESDSDIVKVNKIAKHLVLRMHHQLGNPKDTVFEISPWKQFLYIKNGQSQLYCTQYSLIFSFFCRVNNLITRRIECFGTNDRHTFNEVFIRQSHEWIYNDLTHNISYIKWKQHFISFIDLFEFLHEKRDKHLFELNNYEQSFNQLNIVYADTSAKLSIDTLKEKLLYNFDKISYYHYHKEIDKEEFKKIRNKLSRYIKRSSMYEIYNEELDVQIHFYLKYLVFLIITIVIFLLIRLYFTK